jgi:hypothetical protein
MAAVDFVGVEVGSCGGERLQGRVAADGSTDNARRRWGTLLIDEHGNRK